MNKVVVKIQNEKGKWCTWHNVAVPVKYGNLLDEQLDYAQVSLMRIKKARFVPLTRAQLIITDKYNNSKTLDYFVADDECYENPVGSGCYEHTLTLVEPTKWLECFPLETLTFTNPMGNNYKKIPTGITRETTDDNDISDYKVPESLYTPLSTNISLPNLKEFLVARFENIFNGFRVVTNTGTTPRIIFNVDGEVTTVEYTKEDGSPPFDKLFLKSGEAVVTAIFMWLYKSGTGAIFTIRTAISFPVSIRENSLPLLPYTINGVIQRVLQVVEPLRNGQELRFTFDKNNMPEDKQYLFDKLAPEFTFTRSTLREALQEIGGFIHAEPRLNVANMSIEWDFYGEEETATVLTAHGVKPLKDYKYRTLQRKRNLDETANALDSYQDNLVNRLNWGDATTATPFDGGFQTLRMDTAWARGEQTDSWHIETVESIDKIVKVEMRYNNVTRDITPYIYEKKVYDNISSIGQSYPNAKAVALYYTHGQKGIYGLFFKPSSILSDTGWEEYSIVNIYNTVFDVREEKLDYDKMQFSVTYVPMYSTRVQQCKQHIQDFLPLPRTVNYTQSANSVETQYFGEHIKGAIARMGNAEKNITMDFRSVYNIPKAGQLFDDEYYISEVSTAVSSNVFQVTLGLSKNFNRISKYIGASSIKRIYEVSEEQVQERHTVLQDYIVVGDKQEEILNVSQYGYATESAVFGVAYLFDWQATTDYFSVKSVLAHGSTAKKDRKTQVLLPVISSAFGNSISFTWRYKDNFSAGFKAQFEETGDTSGYFTEETQYTDYYGKLYYYAFKLYSKSVTDLQSHDANELPQHEGFSTYGNIFIAGIRDNVYELILQKDSRETLKFTYNINFVTNNTAYVLGAGLTEKSPLVQDLDLSLGVKARPQLYILPRKLNRFERLVDLSGATEVSPALVSVENGAIYVNGNPAPTSGKAWAYVFPEYNDEETLFEDEYGNVVKLSTPLGGELVVGKNIDIKKNDVVGEFMMQAVHDIYKYYDGLKKLN